MLNLRFLIPFSFAYLWSQFCYSQAPSGTIRGRVVDDQGEPVIAATVFIKEIKRGAYTNQDGIFSIDRIPPGSYTLMVYQIGYDTLVQRVSVKKGQTVTLPLHLSVKGVELEAIEIVGQSEIQIDKQNVTTGVTKISSREITIIPTLGAPDLAQYLQVLPGVVFTGDQGGQLYIRGGTPIMNKVLLDGAVIYSPFHSIGLFSVFDPSYIRSADVYSAGFPSEYGGRISSVIDIQTRNGNFKRYGAKVYASTLMGGALVEGPLFKSSDQEMATSSFLLSWREGYLDRTTLSLYRYVNDTAGLPFAFRDVFGKITIGNGVNTASLFGFYQTDKVDYGFPASVGWRSSGGGGHFTLLPANSNLIMEGNVAASQFSAQLLNLNDLFPRQSSINGFNGGLTFSYILNSVNLLKYGVEVLGFTTDYIFTNSLGFQARQTQNNTEIAAFFRYRKVFQERKNVGTEIVTFDRFVLEPGFRFHYYNNYNYSSLEPRLRMKWNFPNFSISAGLGRFSQNLIPAVSDREIVNLFQGFVAAPEDLPDKKLSHNLQIAWHYLGGIEYLPTEFIKVNLEGWYKDFVQVTNINRERMFPSDPVFITETGYAYGADFTITYQRKSLYLYLTYGYMKTERQGPNNFVYAPVWDRRHTINFVGNYQLGTLKNRNHHSSKWELSVRWNLGSGFPFTQTQGFYEGLLFFLDGAQTDYIHQNGTLQVLLSDEYNKARLPAYHRLDLALKRNFLVGSTGLLQLNLSIINVYNRENIFYFDRKRQVRVNQLPFMPTAGFELQF